MKLTLQIKLCNEENHIFMITRLGTQDVVSKTSLVKPGVTYVTNKFTQVDFQANIVMIIARLENFNMKTIHKDQSLVSSTGKLFVDTPQELKSQHFFGKLHERLLNNF